MTENQSQSQVIFRNRAQTRHVLLYENYLIFCRVSMEHTEPRTNYQYKFSLPINSISLNSVVPDDEKKIELWTATSNKQSDVYILEVDRLIIIACFFLHYSIMVPRPGMLNIKKISPMSFKNWSEVLMTV